MQQTVGTEPVLLGDERTMGEDHEPESPSMSPHHRVETIPGVSRPVIQNLGPGDLYVDFDPEVAVGTGLKLEPEGAPLEFSQRVTHALYVVASEDGTDVRFIDAG